MQKSRFLLPLMVFLPLACASSTEASPNKSGTSSPVVTQSNWNTYQNKYFSVQYPNTWYCEEEIKDMSSTAPLMGEYVSVNFYRKDKNAPRHIVSVKKSSIPADMFPTVELWRDQSIAAKMDDDSYIAVLDKTDNLKVQGYPAASVIFALVLDGDTLLHDQTVVSDGSDIYYLNNTFEYNNMESGYDAMLILETVEFNR